jgi:uncharacterized membrane protein YvbJ
MPAKAKCVHCGKEVFEFVTKCPECGKPVANKYAPVNTSDSPWNSKQENHKKTSLVLPVTILCVVLTVGYIAFHFVK